MANPANPQQPQPRRVSYATVAEIPQDAGPHVEAHDGRFYAVKDLVPRPADPSSWPGIVAIAALAIAIGIGTMLGLAMKDKMEASDFAVMLKKDKGYDGLVAWANQADGVLKKAPTKKSVDDSIAEAFKNYEPEIDAKNVTGLDEVVKKSVGDVGKQITSEVEKQVKVIVASGGACKQQCTVAGSPTPQASKAAPQPKAQAPAAQPKAQAPTPAQQVVHAAPSGVPTHCNWASDGSLRLKAEPLKVIARDVSIMTIAKKDLKLGQTCESWKDEMHKNLADTTSRDVATLRK